MDSGPGDEMLPITAGLVATVLMAPPWRPVFLVTGALFLVIGLTLRSSVAVVSGMLAMGPAVSGAGLPSPTAAMVRTWAWLGRTDHRH